MATSPTVYKHSLVTRITHWLGSLAMLVLFLSGLQIFNAAPYLDASDKSDPAHRVLAIGSDQQSAFAPAHGVTQIFGHTFTTTHFLGFGDDGQGGETARAFPGWITLPAYQDLAGGRRWHLFFAWILVACGVLYLIGGAFRNDLRLVVLRPSDIPKLIPMQLYYLRLRKEPPEYGKYNPLQKLAYTAVLFVFSPLIVISGLALAPGADSLVPFLTPILGGRQFARLWHFVITFAFLGFFLTHMVLVLSTGIGNNLRSMITGKYTLRKGEEGLGP